MGLATFAEPVQFLREKNVSGLRKVGGLPMRVIGLKRPSSGPAYSWRHRLTLRWLPPSRIPRYSIPTLSYRQWHGNALLFVLIDPQLSVMTDDVVAGSVDEARFHRTIVWLSLSRVEGTLLAQMLLLPAAWLAVHAAGVI